MNAYAKPIAASCVSMSNGCSADVVISRLVSLWFHPPSTESVPRRPRPVVVAGILGLLFLITLTIAIHDIPGVAASESPVAMIMRDQLGSEMEKTLLVAVTFAFFCAGIVVMTATHASLRTGCRGGSIPARIRRSRRRS